ncbi:MAG: hypothetical protein ACRD3W_10155 [Terriglobales bacterium]
MINTFSGAILIIYTRLTIAGANGAKFLASLETSVFPHGALRICTMPAAAALARLIPSHFEIQVSTIRDY